MRDKFSGRNPWFFLAKLLPAAAAAAANGKVQSAPRGRPHKVYLPRRDGQQRRPAEFETLETRTLLTTATPTLAITGNGNAINDGSATPSASNGTAFGNVTQGSAFSELYTITNNGTATLNLGTVSLSGTNAGDFSVTSAPSSTVAVGGSTTLIIQFQPSAVGTRTATVSFTENDPTQNSPFTFAISGGGTAAPQMSITGNGSPIVDGATTTSASNVTAFGSTNQGATISELYTITNNGSAALNLGTVSIVGLDPQDFSVTSAGQFRGRRFEHDHDYPVPTHHNRHAQRHGELHRE